MTNGITSINDAYGAEDLWEEVVVVQQGWKEKLEQQLRQNPMAVVGEIGLDRAARVPGTGAFTSYEHQWDLFREQMLLAAHLERPVRAISLARDCHPVTQS
jgi:Tat protein secretion system quality control protein TatD with DNase activity